jgi:ATP/ADP translocase
VIYALIVAFFIVTSVLFAIVILAVRDAIRHKR